MSINAEKVCNAESSKRASSFLALVSSFKFIVGLVVSRNVLDMTLPVTELLQARAIDIMDGIHLIDSLKTLVASVKSQVDHYHDKWYSEAVALAEQIKVKEEMPRSIARQCYRDNPPASNASEYFKRALTINLVNHLDSDLNNRFDNNSLNIYYGLSIIPSKMISLINSNPNSEVWKEQFRRFVSFYENDFANILALDAELDLWQTFWQNYEGSQPDNIASTLKLLTFDGFSNIKVALRILGTIPVTSCECERSISALRRLKTYSRSTMVDERLNGLALMHIHRDIDPNVQDVIKKFSSGNRRLELKL